MESDGRWLIVWIWLGAAMCVGRGRWIKAHVRRQTLKFFCPFHPPQFLSCLNKRVLYSGAQHSDADGIFWLYFLKRNWFRKFCDKPRRGLRKWAKRCMPTNSQSHNAEGSVGVAASECRQAEGSIIVT